MKLLTADIRARLLKNGCKQAPVRGTDDEIDFRPVVKLFTPDASCTWLLTEIDPENHDIDSVPSASRNLRPYAAG